MAAHKTGWVGAAAKPDAGRDPRPGLGAHAGGGRRRNRPARAGPRLDYSPAALYRYFDNREQLTATLAADAMARLAERLRAAAGDGHTDPLLRLGEAYLAFAQEEPVRFRLLFVDLPSARMSLCELPPHDSPYRIVLAAARTAIAKGGSARVWMPSRSPTRCGQWCTAWPCWKAHTCAAWTPTSRACTGWRCST
jgi:hypothetical protein